MEREIAQWDHHEGSIRRSIAPQANALTTELHIAPHGHAVTSTDCTGAASFSTLFTNISLATKDEPSDSRSFVTVAPAMEKTLVPGMQMVFSQALPNGDRFQNWISTTEMDNIFRWQGLTQWNRVQLNSLLDRYLQESACHVGILQIWTD